jgi:integrase
MEEVQNPGEVSLQLGHSDAGIVFAHYRELVTAEDTKAFWALTPKVVLKNVPQVIAFQGEKAVAS